MSFKFFRHINNNNQNISQNLQLKAISTIRNYFRNCLIDYFVTILNYIEK